MSKALKPIRLPNGLRIVVDERPGQALVRIGLFIRCGYMDDPEGLEGLSSISHALMEYGSGAYGQIGVDRINDRGGDLDVITSREHTQITARVLSPNLEDTLSIMMDLIQDPQAPDGTLDFLKASLTDGVENLADEPDELTNRLLDEAVYKDQPGGRYPTPASIARITQADIDQHRATFLVPGNIVLSVVGNVSQDEVVRMVAATQTNRTKKALPPARSYPTPCANDVRTHYDWESTYIRLAFPACSKQHPDYYATVLLNHILGGNGENTHLFQEVREKRGLVYSINTDVDTLGPVGLFSVEAIISDGDEEIDSTTIGQKKTARFMPVICQTLCESINKLTQEELDLAKIDIRRAYITQHLMSEDMMSSMGLSVLLQDNIPTPDAHMRRYQAVTLADVKRIARQIFSSSPAFVAAGHCEGLSSPQEISDMMRNLPPEEPMVSAPVLPPPDIMPRLKLAPLPLSAAGYPKIQMATLANGLRIAVLEQPGCGLVHTSLWVACGSINETAQNNGSFHGIEHMVFKKSENQSAQDIAKLQQNGNTCNAITGTDSTRFQVTGFAENFATNLARLTNMVLHPTFSHGLREEKGAILEEIKLYDQDTDFVLDHAIMADAFQGQSLGQPLLGPARNIRRMSRKSLSEIHAQHYVPDNMLLVVTGDISLEDVVRTATPLLEQEPRKPLPPPVPEVHFTGGHTTFLDANEETDYLRLVLTFPNTRQHDPDSRLSDILSHILNRRMSKVLYDQNQLACAYSASSETHQHAGTFRIRLEGTTPTTAQGLSLILHELRNMQQDISAEEINIVCDKIQMGLLNTLEDPDKAAEMIGSSMLGQSRLLDLQALVDTYKNTTPTEIRNMARQIFANLPNITAIGLPCDLPTPQKIQAMLKTREEKPCTLPHPGLRPCM